MSKRQPKPDRDYDIPVVHHAALECDMAAHMVGNEELPVGGFERVENMLPLATFDGLPSIGLTIKVTLKGAGDGWKYAAPTF